MWNMSYARQLPRPCSGLQPHRFCSMCVCYRCPHTLHMTMFSLWYACCPALCIACADVVNVSCAHTCVTHTSYVRQAGVCTSMLPGMLCSSSTQSPGGVGVCRLPVNCTRCATAALAGMTTRHRRGGMQAGPLRTHTTLSGLYSRTLGCSRMAAA